MHFTNTLLIVLTSALATSATNVHNQFGVNGDIQDRVGTVQGLPNGGSVAIGGGWGFFWVDASACHGGANSGVLQWPADFGDVWIKADGHLYDNGNNQVPNSGGLCSRL